MIDYITNASSRSGVGHRASEIVKRLRSGGGYEIRSVHMDGLAGTLVVNNQVVKRVARWPGMLGSKSANWIRLGARYRAHAADSELNHLTNQSLSFLAKKLHPSIVTVHDIIEVTEPQDWRAAALNNYLYSGITHADHIIAVSEFTKRAVVHHYEVEPSQITVIPNGVDRTVFKPIDDYKESTGYKELKREYKIPDGKKVILYVGSDHPRKNVATAVRAIASISNAVLLKVGEPGIPAGRAELLEVIDELGVRDRVIFIGNVSFERLNELYNTADVLIYPSNFEGFGLPPLEAMAVGTPVVTSTAASLPEVVGDDDIYGARAAHVHDPDDVDAFSRSLQQILEDEAERQRLHEAGLKRAQLFSWDEAAKKVTDVYGQVLKG